MGNKNNRDNDLKVYIQTQKAFYNSGSIIEGVVFVKAIKNFAFDALYIRIQGSSKNRKKYVGNQTFYNVEHILQKYQDRHLKTGQYVYPFAFELSQNIPGSFIPKSYQAKIQYKLIAYFIDYSNSQTTQIQHIPLLIRQPFRQQIVPYEGKIQKCPKTCFCFNQGTITLQAWFQSIFLSIFKGNVAFQGQEIRIQILSDNKNGKKDLNTFLIELVQYIFVCSNNGVYRTYSKVISSNKINQLVKINEKKSFQYHFKIPEIKHQSSYGTLVANYYRIQVSTKTSIIASEDPCIYAPLFLLKKDLKQYGTNNLSLKGKKQQFTKINASANKPKFFSAPQYWFKKNKNLTVINFKLQQNIGLETNFV